MAFVCVQKDGAGYLYRPVKSVLSISYDYKKNRTTIAALDEVDDLICYQVSGEPTFIGVGE